MFAELSGGRRREISSAIAHYIAGVLDENSLINIVNSLSETVSLNPGDRVKTLRGTLKGVVKKTLEDGRIVWRPDDALSDMTAQPESLLPDSPSKK